MRQTTTVTGEKSAVVKSKFIYFLCISLNESLCLEKIELDCVNECITT